MKTVGYLIPEFPGQTHVWMWREITHLREWGGRLRIYSTRRPPQQDRARHAFAEQGEREACFLWPRGLLEVLVVVLWAVATRPRGLARCLWMGLTLSVEPGPAWRRVLPLVIPACVLARDVRGQSVSHLHCQSAKSSAILCMMVRRLCGVPYSLVINANLEWWGGAMGPKLRESAFIVTHAQWILEQVRRDYPDIDPSRSVRASVGVDTRLWSPRERRREGAALRVVSVGRLHFAKAHDALIRAVGELVREGRDVTLRIVGGGPEEAKLRALIGEMRLEGVVTLVGSVSEDRVLEEVRDADVFALASPEEPLGVVFMEAMACGLPVVGSQGGGVKEIVTDGVDGLLVPARDDAALAGALRRLILDDSLRARLGGAARASIVERFDSRIGARILFERLFGAAPSEAPAQVPS